MTSLLVARHWNRHGGTLRSFEPISCSFRCRLRPPLARPVWSYPPHLGVAQGIWSILVATALAIVALRVATAVVIPGLLLLPLVGAAIVFAARPAC